MRPAPRGRASSTKRGLLRLDRLARGRCTAAVDDAVDRQRDGLVVPADVVRPVQRRSRERHHGDARRVRERRLHERDPVARRGPGRRTRPGPPRSPSTGVNPARAHAVTKHRWKHPPPVTPSHVGVREVAEGDRPDRGASGWSSGTSTNTGSALTRHQRDPVAAVGGDASPHMPTSATSSARDASCSGHRPPTAAVTRGHPRRRAPATSRLTKRPAERRARRCPTRTRPRPARPRPATMPARVVDAARTSPGAAPWRARGRAHRGPWGGRRAGRG